MSAIRGTEPVDLSRLDDPVAAQIDWSPVSSREWANFRSHNLVKLGADRLTFQPNVVRNLFWIPFLCMGALAIVVGIGALFDGSFGGLIAIVVGGFFVYGSVIEADGLVSQFMIDRAAGSYWYGNPDSVAGDPELEKLECHGKLSDVHALQLLSASHDTEDGYVKTYQLVLVLEDKTRHCIIDQGGLWSLQKDARQLGQFIGVPVWDSTLWSRIY